MTPIAIFIMLLLAGLLLIGLEIFVPGGILGLFGAISLIGSIVMGFVAFGPQMGLLATMGVFILLGLCIVMWIKFFPDTPVGRALTLSKSGQTFKATPEENPSLLGKEGVAQTDLRPGGIAKIEGHRVDVIAEGGWIEVNAAVRVVEVEGNRIVVRAVTPTAGQATGEAS